MINCEIATKCILQVDIYLSCKVQQTRCAVHLHFSLRYQIKRSEREVKNTPNPAASNGTNGIHATKQYFTLSYMFVPFYDQLCPLLINYYLFEFLNSGLHYIQAVFVMLMTVTSSLKIELQYICICIMYIFIVAFIYK